MTNILPEEVRASSGSSSCRLRRIVGAEAGYAWEGTVLEAVQCPRCGEEILLATRCPYCGALAGGAGAVHQEKARHGAESANPGEQTVYRVYKMGEAQGAPTSETATRGRHSRFRPEHAASARSVLGSWQRLKRWYRLYRDPAAPRWLRYLPLIAIGYLLFPFDLLPDVIPVLGWADDVAVIWIIWSVLTHFLDSYAHRSTRQGRVQAESASQDGEDRP